jgi:hypothetical protein
MEKATRQRYHLVLHPDRARVPHPDQSDLPSGSLRFSLSWRATGEGRISSISFRTLHE